MIFHGNETDKFDITAGSQAGNFISHISHGNCWQFKSHLTLNACFFLNRLMIQSELSNSDTGRRVTGRGKLNDLSTDDYLVLIR